MQIVLATPVYPPEIGGPATYTKELCERLSDTHHLTVVALSDEGREFPRTKLIKISKQQNLSIRLWKFFTALYTSSKEADLIYVQNAMAAGLPTALVSIFTGIPFILKFVGDEAWERATQSKHTTKLLEEFYEHPAGPLRIRLMMLVQGWVLRRAELVTTPSEYLGRAIQKKYNINPERIKTNYNAGEETESYPIETPKVKHQMVTTARLTSWKGVDGIIRATALLKEKYPDIRFVCAGDGPEMENLKNLAHELSLDKEVNLLGKISRAETWQLRKTSEVYVLNSTYEGLPHTVLTSFAAEIPTVATNIPGTDEAVYHESTGLLVHVDSPNEIAEAVSRLFENPDLQKTLVENGKKLLKEKFSWEAHIKTLNSFFETVCLKPSK